ncbi:MAG TPA: class I SAM-dependent methyltransferase [Pyrinomonadaceae bacterium]|nr:class I SAM-dependent methyltransferase [Pyrinomonadaceae bacterium]
MSEFAEFEHKSWQRVAEKYDAAWSSLTRSFIPALLVAVNIRNGVRVLDLACGPGYVAAASEAAGAEPIGVDFSSEMVRLARAQNPTIEFREGDAHALEFPDESFDVVMINFGLLHMADPQGVISESSRVLRAGGRIGFTVWADPRLSVGAKIVQDAITEYANQDVGVPQGPECYAFSQPRACQAVLTKAGFDPSTFNFETVFSEWLVSSPNFLFESELKAGVRTAALLKAQTPETLEKISQHIAAAVVRYEKGDGYAITFAAHVVTGRRKKKPIQRLKPGS